MRVRDAGAEWAAHRGGGPRGAAHRGGQGGQVSQASAAGVPCVRAMAPLSHIAHARAPHARETLRGGLRGTRALHPGLAVPDAARGGVWPLTARASHLRQIPMIPPSMVARTAGTGAFSGWMPRTKHRRRSAVTKHAFQTFTGPPNVPFFLSKIFIGFPSTATLEHWRGHVLG